MFKGQKDTYMNDSNELRRTKGKLHELQVCASIGENEVTKVLNARPGDCCCCCSLIEYCSTFP